MVDAMKQIPERGATDLDRDHAIKQLIDRENAMGSVTLAANTTTTTVDHPLVTDRSVILLSPQTANAAAAGAFVPSAAIGRGTFAITHASSATTDRTFVWICRGS
jgi:hypothetical protein